MLEAFTLHFSFKSKLKWMPCLLLSSLPFIAQEEWDNHMLEVSLQDCFIVFSQLGAADRCLCLHPNLSVQGLAV